MAECNFPQNLTPREVARIRHRTVGHLANERSRGLGPPYIRDGGRILYPSDSLREYLNERIVDPTRKAG